MPSLNPHRIRINAAALALAAFTVGCGKSHQPVRVAGTVTVDGTPVPRGAVSFLLPNSKAAAAGAAIQDGAFTATVPPGSYRVTVTGSRPVPGKTIKTDMGEEPVVESIVPARYATDSPLTAEVTTSGADLKFALDGIKTASKAKR